MSTPTEYREEASEYVRQADVAFDSRRLQLLDMAKTCLQLAENEEWLRRHKYRLPPMWV